MSCVNCDYPLNEEDKFCTSCGNKIICDRLTNKSLINEFSSKYLSLDSKLWVTIKDMTIRPEKVIKSYINNNRTKYLPPVNFMIISAFLGGFYAYLLNNGYLGEIDLNFLKSSSSPNESELGLNQEELTRTINSEVQKYYSVLLFLTIPLLALFS